jgi:hypothetical protein
VFSELLENRKILIEESSNSEPVTQKDELDQIVERQDKMMSALKDIMREMEENAALIEQLKKKRAQDITLDQIDITRT